jgi:hypothetical protein
MLPCFYPWSINVVVYHDPSGKSHLGKVGIQVGIGLSSKGVVTTYLLTVTLGSQEPGGSLSSSVRVLVLTPAPRAFRHFRCDFYTKSFRKSLNP